METRCENGRCRFESDARVEAGASEIQCISFRIKIQDPKAVSSSERKRKRNRARLRPSAAKTVVELDLEEKHREREIAR